VAETIRVIFNAPNREEAERLLSMAIAKYQDSASDLANWMETAIPEGLTVFIVPMAHQKKLRTSNLAERVNKEISAAQESSGFFLT